MSQSNYIAAALALAFIVFITMRGSLTKYINILMGTGGQVADADVAGGEPSKDVATGETPPASNAEDEEQSSAEPALTLLQQVVKAGGPADDVLDGVKMFDLAGFLG